MPPRPGPRVGPWVSETGLRRPAGEQKGRTEGAGQAEQFVREPVGLGGRTGNLGDEQYPETGQPERADSAGRAQVAQSRQDSIVPPSGATHFFVHNVVPPGWLAQRHR